MSREKKPKAPKLADRALLPEPEEAAGPDRDLCQKCGLYTQTRTPFLRAEVPPGWTKALLVVVSPEDDHRGAHSALRETLAGEGYQPRDLAWARAVRCGVDEPNMTQIRCCRPFLLGTISRLQPEALLGAGDAAARSLTNSGQATITGLRGRQVTVAPESGGVTQPADEDAPSLVGG